MLCGEGREGGSRGEDDNDKGEGEKQCKVGVVELDLQRMREENERNWKGEMMGSFNHYSQRTQRQQKKTLPIVANQSSVYLTVVNALWSNGKYLHHLTHKGIPD